MTSLEPFLMNGRTGTLGFGGKERATAARRLSRTKHPARMTATRAAGRQMRAQECAAAHRRVLAWLLVAAGFGLACNGSLVGPEAGPIATAQAINTANDVLDKAFVHALHDHAAILSLRALGRAIAVVADSFTDPWGQTFAYHLGGGYSPDPRAGAPSDGLRFILYKANPDGQLAYPLAEIGHVDVQPSGVDGYRAHVAVGGAPDLDYTLTGTSDDTLASSRTGALTTPRTLQATGTLGTVPFEYRDTLFTDPYFFHDRRHYAASAGGSRLAISNTYSGSDVGPGTGTAVHVAMPGGGDSVTIDILIGPEVLDPVMLRIDGDTSLVTACESQALCSVPLAHFEELARQIHSGFREAAEALLSPAIAALRVAARQAWLNSVVSATTATSGTPPDPDGYTLIIDDSLTLGIGLNDSIVLPSLPPGSHDVALAGVAANCYVQGYDYAHVVIPGSARIPFNVSCDTSAVRSGQLLVQEEDGLYLIAVDGTARIKMPIVGNAAWSPDGSQFAVDGSDGLYLVNADGSGVLMLKRVGVLWGAAPAWSSDGTRLAYVQCSIYGCDIFSIWRDGTHETKLTDTGHSSCPSWSPDGTELAFLTTGAQAYDLDVVRTDGTGLSTLASGVGGCPNWSPDGSHLTFTPASASAGSGEVWVIQSDGNGLVNLTSGYVDCCSQWSPDGSSILFFRVDRAHSAAGLYLVPPTGGAAHAITTGRDVSPGEWSRDGSRIVFTGGAVEESSHVYVMDAAGTWISQVTHDRARDLSWPHLRP